MRQVSVNRETRDSRDVMSGLERRSCCRLRGPHVGRARLLHFDPTVPHQLMNLFQVLFLVSGRPDDYPFDWQILAQVFEQANEGD